MGFAISEIKKKTFVVAISGARVCDTSCDSVEAKCVKTTQSADIIGEYTSDVVPGWIIESKITPKKKKKNSQCEIGI